MINGVTDKVNVDELIMMALKEDISSEDVTTNAIMKEEQLGMAELICKQDGVICGLPVFKRVFELLDERTEVIFNCAEGSRVKKGELVGVVKGDIRVLLSGERTALNYLQRMSGIATFTAELMSELTGYKTKLLDTRKTTPNNRIFEKYAVKVGGATNHRYNLSDGVLIKDNHIGAAGSITKAVAMARDYAPFVRKIEVEVETLEQLDEALEAGADIIMLENMDNATMTEAVKRVAGRAETECSGNVTKERLKEIAEIGVDYVSSGALTYGAPIMDLSLKNLRPVE
ncbi:MAG: carboxylating nicotinate-nucleotide diphosphorylase [Lachnospiraceae bacterium]|nr:carboxylating nicotinate-nucleotide diphosphorylase [Lachnospiraceae bacterium]